MLSVLGDGPVGHVEHRLDKGKLQHDLAFIVRHFQDRTQKATLGALGLQEFADHRPRDFPCTIKILQFFAFRVGDQFVADLVVEKVSRQGSKTTSVKGPSLSRATSQGLYLKLRRAMPRSLHSGRSTGILKLLIR